MKVTSRSVVKLVPGIIQKVMKKMLVKSEVGM